MQPFEGNLAGLAQRQPDLARRLGALKIAGTVLPATGRDGSPTFLIPATKSGRSAWFGGSSMPSISARELFADFRSDGHSVCLPGVLTGLEPKIVAGRIPAFCAVFVVEKEPWRLRLALQLHDYRSLIDQGRIVFLLADALEEMLICFFKNHSGFSLPTRLLPVPQCGAAELAELQSKLETAAKSVLDIQQKATESCRGRLSGRPRARLTQPPRLAIISNDARSETVEEALRLHRAASLLGWPVKRCVVDSPGACHVVGRLSAIEEGDCNLALFVNCLDEHVSALLPEWLPTATWLLGSLPAGPAPGGAPSKRLYLAPAQSVKDSLIGQGVNEQWIELCGPGAEVGEWPRNVATDSAGDIPPCDVSVMFDLPDNRAVSCGVTLTSHVLLWQRIQDEVSRQVDKYDPDEAEWLLERAERNSGVSLKDPAGRERFLWYIRGVIAPAIQGRMAAAALAEHGVNLSVWGHHWPTGPDTSRLARALRGPLASGEARRRVIGMAKIVVLGVMNPLAVRTALDVTAGGRFAVCRGTPAEFTREYPMLANIAPAIRFYRTCRELVETVTELNSPNRRDGNERDAARESVLTHHGLDKRLAAIVERLRD